MIFLYFRHLFEKLDGGKFKWTAPKGPIGDKIKGLNDNLTPLVQFQPIPTKVPPVASDLFKTAVNRQRLHEICISISTGHDTVHRKFVINEYPPISITRWLTPGERVCGQYIREPDPSPEMIVLVIFISQAYGPAHFDIYLNPGFENSSHHYLTYIKRSKVMLSVLFSKGLSIYYVSIILDFF